MITITLPEELVAAARQQLDAQSRSAAIAD